jgi:hypothetical protein
MAQKFYLYKSDLAVGAGQSDPTNHILSADDAVMALYTDIVKTMSGGVATPASAPTAYATLEDAVTAGGVSTRISPRGLNLTIPGFGSAFMPIMDNSNIINGTQLDGNDWPTTLSLLGLVGTDPLTPQPVAERNLGVVCDSYRGEQRSA